VDTSSARCTPSPPGPDSTGAVSSCYLPVQAMAFRSWNRGLALMSDTVSSPYGVWTYNGTEWAPNPSFPGSSTCQGNTILWAGKLDYWVIGYQTGANGGLGPQWPALCRYDGADFVWQTLPIPAAALASAPISGITSQGAITSGACFAWNNCWFFGTGGVELHWDGTALATVSSGLGASPWLGGDYQAATVGTDSAGDQFGVAVSRAATGVPLVSLPSQPDGAAPPQVFRSTGGPFQATALQPVADVLEPQQFPYPTNLVAIGYNVSGDGWLAGGPDIGGSSDIAPLIPIADDASQRTCPAISATTFSWPTYTWTSVGTLPDGDALAGGEFTSTGDIEPVIVDASCSDGPASTMFRVPDPTVADQAEAGLVPADSGGIVSSVTVSADNDAWAATTPGGIGNDAGSEAYEPPHLYQYTDGQTPDAPAGDDNEVRVVSEPPEPTIYETPPPVVVPPPPVPVVIKTAGKTKRKSVKLPSPIYDVKVAKPKAAGHGSFALKMTFRVRRTVTIGAEALRGKRVVASSGLHTFHGKTGHLTLRLDRKAWPTGLKFVLGGKTKKAIGPAVRP
jgi:hypothetical protein